MHGLGKSMNLGITFSNSCENCGKLFDFLASVSPRHIGDKAFLAAWLWGWAIIFIMTLSARYHSHYLHVKVQFKIDQHLDFSCRVCASVFWDKNKACYLLNVLNRSHWSYLFKNICILILSHCTISYVASLSDIDKFKIINSIPLLIKMTNRGEPGQKPVQTL